MTQMQPYVKTEFSADIRKHVDFLTVRAGWDESKDAPSTTHLPEQIKANVACAATRIT